jgi:hypothetical protein
MVILAIRIKRALDVAVQRPHDADARKHRWTARSRHQDQGFHGGGASSGSPLSGKSIGSGISYDLHSRRAHFNAWE